MPNILTILRIFIIPLFILSYYLPFAWSRWLGVGLFLFAAITDWLDGYLARKLKQTSPFGAFMDPVADKLIVICALILLVSDPLVQQHVWGERIFNVIIFIIVGREIAVSALREWMAETGKRARVAVSWLGKFKTVAQMTAITFLLFRGPLWGIPLLKIGELLLYVAAILTIWSMLLYLKAAWPELSKHHTDEPKP